MTLFKGLGEKYRPSSNPSLTGVGGQQVTTFPAQVLQVCMDSSSDLYSDETDIGAIRFRPLRLIQGVTKIYEEEIANVAYPLDRSVARYPLPGEQVIISISAGDAQRASADQGQLISTFFYSFIVSSQKNVTYNSHPFIGADETEIRRQEVVATDQASRRFDNQVADLSSYKDGDNKIKIFKQLRPFEGDFILQGRFGNTIRFGSTSAVANTPWTRPGSTISGVSGDPILVMRVDRQTTANPSEMLVEEDVNQDDSSIYLCSSQRIELLLSCTSKLKAWANTLGIENKAQKGATSLLSSATGTTQLPGSTNQ